MVATCDLRLAATGLVVVLALGGCSGEQNAPSAAPVSPSVATPTMSSTPTPSPATAQERAAVDAVLAYIRVVDKLGIDPTSDIDELNTVATGDALAQMQYILLNYRKDGWHQVGEQVPTFVSSTPGSTASEWTISMCVDVSAVDVLDADGNSVKNPDSEPRLLVDYDTVESAAAGQWYVQRDKAVDSC